MRYWKKDYVFAWESLFCFNYMEGKREIEQGRAGGTALRGELFMPGLFDQSFMHDKHNC